MSSKKSDLIERAGHVFTPNIRPAPILIDRGEGCRVFDLDGTEYLDLVSGIAVSALGHNHPKLVAAIRDQAGKVLHTSNLYWNAPEIELAEKIVAGGFAEQVYFCNSGAEANEAALKLARKFAHDAGDTARNEIISFRGSFHGRTFGALAATAQPKYHVGFEPLPRGFVYLDLGDVSALEAAISERCAAVIIEPIQGEGGVRVPPEGFLRACRQACDRAGALLIFDEVQVGAGRTGLMFAHQHEGVEPDIMSLAKGIGGGMPLGAMVTTARVGASLTYGSHATTYGGNPVATRAGCVVFDELAAPGFLEHVREVGARLSAGLEEIAAKTGVFSEVRGRGLLIGAELAPDLPFDAKALVDACRQERVLAHLAGPSVLRLVPPLILRKEEAEEGLAAIARAVDQLVHAS